MALKTKTKVGGDFFKGGDWVTAKAVLIENSEYHGQVHNERLNTMQHSATADVTIFNSLADLDGETDPVIMTQTKLSGVLAKDLEGEDGEQLCWRLELIPNKKGKDPFPVWKVVDPAIVEKVEAYLERRDGAEKEALANLPADLFGDDDADDTADEA